ncbi:hypothetical protein GCM10011583_07250 [Streptomyces camponoticapitis]|uniref:DUF4352 domain-containing protein n=1 Tax=Streptomyces camponoticapitis TaxID=1616125 RepID=A0ABQ2E006_9ACTN|nr:hypothetical protein [Streptomyces camponoticapitis]GGJ78313.1 hypothetical protein GCM10011583_07250 [Streptomyces camponoticapitis]
MTRSSRRGPLGRTVLAVAVGAACTLTGCVSAPDDSESDDGRSTRTVRPARTAVLLGDTVLVNHPDGPDEAMLALAVTAVVDEASQVAGAGAAGSKSGAGGARQARAEDGRKWIAVLAEVSNAGARPYAHDVAHSFTAVDGRGHRHAPLPASADLTVGPMMTWTVPLAAGRTARGWLVFDLPADAVLTALEFGRTRTSAASANWAL